MTMIICDQKGEKMSELIHHFSTKLTIIQGSYTNNVMVYDDHVDITREGRTTLPKQLTIFFDTATSVFYGKNVRPFISFTVPGRGSDNHIVTALRPGESVIPTGMQLSYNDPFTIIGGIHENLETHYKIIKKVFDDYKKNVSAAPAINQTVVQQEDALDKLKKLKELYDLGVLTEAEFEEKKKKLLSEI